MATGSAMYGCITAALPVMGMGCPQPGYTCIGMDLARIWISWYTGEDPKRLQWISNTISHNTVVVDKSKQDAIW